MRGTWSVAILLLGMTGLACVSKQKRVLREPTVQIYDLPPLDAKAFNDPPTYPEEKATLPNQKSIANGGKAGMGGPGGMGGGMAPSSGGAGMGSPGMTGMGNIR
jgi:hypothetical protein